MLLSEKPIEELQQPVDGLTPAAESSIEPAAEPADVNADVIADEEIETTETTREAPAASREEVISRLKLIADRVAEEIANDDVTRLKLQFYSLHNDWLQTLRDKWVAEGNSPEEFDIPADEFEPEFKELLNAIKEKKNQARIERERIEAENLNAKKEIIEQILTLAADTDNVNRHYQTAKDLQARFKEIGEVPPQSVGDIWKQYQDAVERFYDQFKINMDLRDYDFKKNLSEKQLLIEEAQKLTEETDVIVAFKRLQSLHDKWRLTGPVAKDLREETWSKFKDASAIINKRYQDFFEARKAKELENEQAKTALCEQVEAIDVAPLNSYTAWDNKTKEVLAAQEAWKQLGFASRKVNNALFARFREACDKFFSAKAAFFTKMKDELNENLKLKTALAERAEQLSTSTDWRKTTDEFVKLQQEWKKIGAVQKKHSDAIWKRFHDACDKFFDAKKQATGGQRATEMANLKAKQDLIERLNAVSTEMPREEAIARLKEVQAEWPTIGHVPFKEKDKIYEAYRTACDRLYKELDLKGKGARMNAFTKNLDEIASDGNKLSRERERLTRACEARINDLHTYENNMGFLSSKSKSGDSMVRQMQRRIDDLKEEIESLREKIRLIDAKL